MASATNGCAAGRQPRQEATHPAFGATPDQGAIPARPGRAGGPRGKAARTPGLTGVTGTASGTDTDLAAILRWRHMAASGPGGWTRPGPSGDRPE